MCSIKTRGGRVVSVRDARASMRTAFSGYARASVFFPADVVSWLREGFLAGSGAAAVVFFFCRSRLFSSFRRCFCRRRRRRRHLCVLFLILRRLHFLSICVDVFRLGFFREESLFLFVNVPVCRSIFRFVAWNLFLMAFGGPGISLAKMAH